MKSAVPAIHSSPQNTNDSYVLRGRGHVTWEVLPAPVFPRRNINYLSNLTSRAVTMKTTACTCSNKNLINIFVDMENNFFLVKLELLLNLE